MGISCWWNKNLFRNWAVQVDGRALGVLVAHELRVQLLVSLQGDATLLVVLLLLLANRNETNTLHLVENGRYILLVLFLDSFQHIPIRSYILADKDTYADQVVVGIIDQLDVINSQTGDAVVTVLLYADQTVVVDVHHLVVGINEGLHRLQNDV